MRCGNDMMSGPEKFIICSCFGEVNAQCAVRNVSLRTFLGRFKTSFMLSVLELLQLLLLPHVRESNNAATGLAYTEEEEAQCKLNTNIPHMLNPGS